MILASKLSELEEFENRAANYQLASIKGGNEAKEKKPIPLIRFRKGAESKMMLSFLAFCPKTQPFARKCNFVRKQAIPYLTFDLPYRLTFESIDGRYKIK